MVCRDDLNLPARSKLGAVELQSFRVQEDFGSNGETKREKQNVVDDERPSDACRLCGGALLACANGPRRT